MLDQVEIFHGLSDEELKALEGSSQVIIIANRFNIH